MIGFLVLVTLASAGGAVWFRRSAIVRALAVLSIAACTVPALGALIAPHRLAQESKYQSWQDAAWQRGARDTRDVIHRVLPILAAAFSSLVVLALVPRVGTGRSGG